MRAAITETRRIAPDFAIAVDRVLSDGDRAAISTQIHRRGATNQVVFVFRGEAGRFAEMWTYR